MDCCSWHKVSVSLASKERRWHTWLSNFRATQSICLCALLLRAEAVLYRESCWRKLSVTEGSFKLCQFLAVCKTNHLLLYQVIYCWCTTMLPWRRIAHRWVTGLLVNNEQETTRCTVVPNQLVLLSIYPDISSPMNPFCKWSIWMNWVVKSSRHYYLAVTCLALTTVLQFLSFSISRKGTLFT
jgi:hypothetical protein